jgi:hypothetical protein
LVLPDFNLYEALKIDDPKKVESRDVLLPVGARDLNGAIFDGAVLPKVDFSGARLQSASLDDAQLQGASFVGAKLQGASLDRAKLQGASLRNADLRGASLSEAKLQGAWLDGANLQGARLDEAELLGASLHDAQVQGASFEGAQLQGAAFSAADMTATNLKSAFVWRVLPNWWGKMKNMFSQELNWEPRIFDWPRRPQMDLFPWTKDRYAALQQQIRQALPEGLRRTFALKRIEILDCNIKSFGQPSRIKLPTCEPGPTSPEWVQGMRKDIHDNSVPDEAAYGKALAEVLRGLVCDGDRSAYVLLEGLRGNGRIKATGVAAPGLIDYILSNKDCAVSAGLSKDYKASLRTKAKEAATKAIEKN